MIPKVIHYCWLSGDRKPQLVRKCMKSWRKLLPDYEIKCWDKNSFDINSIPFVKEAVEKKKWAFAADYIRLYALYTEGGVYLDSDVEVFKRFDYLLSRSFFTGLETRDRAHSEFFPESAIMGAEKGHEFIRLCMEAYQERHFILLDGTCDMTPIPTIMLPLMVNYYQWTPSGQEVLLKNNAIVLSTDIIANSYCEIKDSICLYHRNNRSWEDYSNRGPIFHWFRNHNLMSVFCLIERLIRIMKKSFCKCPK